MSSTLDRLLPAKATPWASAASRARLGKLVEQAKKASCSARLADLGETAAILAATPAQQAEIAGLAVAFIDALLRSLTFGIGMMFSAGDSEMASLSKSLASKLLARPLPWQPEALVRMVDGVTARLHWMPGPGILRAIEKSLGGAPVPPALREALGRLRTAALATDYKATRELARSVDALLAGPPADDATAAPPAIEPVDAWTIALHAALAKQKAKPRAAIEALLAHAAKATTAKPGKTWLATARALVDAIGRPAHAALLQKVLVAVGTAAPFDIEVRAYEGVVQHQPPVMISDRHVDALRGLVWSAIVGDTAALIGAVGDCAERCFKKLPGHGPLAPRIGNACLQVLSHVPSDEAVGQLARLKVRARHPSVRALLDKAVVGAAERTGLTPAELEEIGVPTCGLDAIGRRTMRVGAVTATLGVGGDAGVEVGWTDRAGAPCAAPAKLAGKPAAQLAALKRAQKELAGQVAAQRLRLERMLIGGRTVPYAAWRERYADHVLVGALARRLIWWCTGVDKGQGPRLVGFDGERLVDVAGKTVTPAPAAPMWLWHPIHSAASVVRAWRDWLARRGIRQPFKQAHREIYLLTDAERATGTYSNRFAAHVLRQHQLAALGAQRGWRYTLQGDWDSHNTPYLELRDHGWRVEYWVEAPEEATTRGTGVAYLVSTDKVAFRPIGAAEPGRLEDVPRMVFTEGMRDVDLFVGVASVGNDPTWQDSGDDGRHRDYWHRQAFGDPGESGRARHAALKRLLPRLAIARRCTLGERFLTVRGALRTYHIHLGSAAVQMEPDSQYLCIVPGRSAVPADGAGVMLPFEGDRTLSLILSKALLLAADDRITDRSIRSQLAERAGPT